MQYFIKKFLILKRKANTTLRSLFYTHKKSKLMLNTGILSDKHDLTLVAVCFNNSEVIKLQNKYLKKKLD